ncbi:MAG: NAD-dependent epimerase/dehydratase family protein [Chloroflexota bacterium]
MARGRPIPREEGRALAQLITGIGYIGARLAADLLATGEQVVGIDNLFATDRQAIDSLRRHPRFTFVRGSVNSPATLARAFAVAPIETVYALAAQASAHPDAASPRYTEVTNLLSPRLLLEAAAAHGVRRLVYGSSLRVYGDVPPAQAVEDHPYGRFADLSHLSKIYVEKLLEMHAHAGGPRAVAARLGLVYGLGPVTKMDYRFLTAPNKFCLQAVRGETLTVSAGGLCPQALVHVSDAARALRLLADLDDLPPYAAVNVATETATMLDVARAVADAGERRGLSVRVAAPSAQTVAAEYGLAPSRLRGAGFVATRELSEATAETLAFYADRVNTEPAQ